MTAAPKTPMSAERRAVAVASLRRRKMGFFADEIEALASALADEKMRADGMEANENAAVAEANRQRERADAAERALAERTAEVERLQKAAKTSRSAMVGYLEDHPHSAPDDCYATGPVTGNAIYDLVRCPGCCAENSMKDAIHQIDATLSADRTEPEGGL